MADDNGDQSNGNCSLLLEQIVVSPTTEGTALGMKNEEKLLTVLLDESKVPGGTADEMTAGNILPLFPQWLYAKPSETKTGISTAPVDLHATNSSSHSNSTDAMHNEGCCIDENHDKKEQRVGLETETSCHWREEEREADLHGRRYYRTYDRRAGNGSNKETAEGRVLTSCDRWNNVGNSTGGLDTHRDGKWTSRWDPENKENDSLTGKKICTEKGDSVMDKLSFAANAGENDSCDKWRPRHRMEGKSSRSSYPTVRGYCPGRGSVEGSTVRFSLGRGRSMTSGSSPLGRPSPTELTGAPVDKSSQRYEKPYHGSDKFRYPRGKLLDIYRKQRLLPSFDDMPKGMENVKTVAQSTSNEPLAFIAPNAEEGAILRDILNGKLTHVERTSNSSIAVRRSNENVKGARNLKGVLSTAKPGELKQSEEVTLVNYPKFSDAESVVPVVSTTESSNASASLYDALTLKTVPLSCEQYSENDGDENLLKRGTPTNDLSLYHKDPQGGIQGHFPNAGIISWSDKGYSGTDLLACLPDASEGRHFQKLGNLMPHRNTMAVISEHHLANSNVEISNVYYDRSGTSGKLVPASPGEPKSDSRDPVKKPSGNLYGTRKSSVSCSSLATGPAEPSMLNPIDNNIYSFGLLWSDHKGSRSNYPPYLNTPSGNGQTHLINSHVLRETPLANREENSIAGCTRSAPFVEAWSDTYKNDTKFYCQIRNAVEGDQFHNIEPDGFMDPYLEQFRSMESENKHPNDKNQFCPRPALHTNQPITQNAGHFQSRNPVCYQHPISQPIPDLGNLLTIQAQCQRQFHFQLHQLQEYKVHHLLLEQIHPQKHYPGYSDSEYDHQNEKNTIQQVYGQSYGHGGRQRLYSSRHSDPLLEQLRQAKFGEDIQRDHQDYLYGEMQSSGLGLNHQQDQLQAKLLMKPHATHHCVSDDETRQFGRGSIDSLPSHPAGVGLGAFNCYQHQLRPFLDKQLNSEKILALEEQQLQGVYKPNSTLFVRSGALSAGHGMDLESVCVQNIDMWCHHMNSVHPVGSVTTKVHPFQPRVSHSFHTSNIDTSESQSNGLLENSMDTSMQVQFERDKSEAEMLSKGTSLWCTTDASDESSMPILVDLFHGQLDIQNAQSFEASGSSPPSFSDKSDSSESESKFASYSESDPQSGESSSFSEGTQDFHLGKPLQGLYADVPMNDQSSCLESGDKMSKSHSEQQSKEQFLLGMRGTSQALYVNFGMADSSLDAEAKADSQLTGDCRSRCSEKNQIQGIIAEQSGRNNKYEREVPPSVSVEEDSPGMTDENSESCSIDMGINALSTDTEKRTVSSVQSEGSDNLLPSERVMILQSQETILELVSDTMTKEEHAACLALFDDHGLESGLNSATKVSASLTPSRDLRLQRKSPCSDPDVSKILFMDTLKSPSKEPLMSESNIRTGTLE